MYSIFFSLFEMLCIGSIFYSLFSFCRDIIWVYDCVGKVFHIILVVQRKELEILVHCLRSNVINIQKRELRDKHLILHVTLLTPGLSVYYNFIDYNNNLVWKQYKNTGLKA